jgi:hypothetical protein
MGRGIAANSHDKPSLAYVLRCFHQNFAETRITFLRKLSGSIAFFVGIKTAEPQDELRFEFTDKGRHLVPKPVHEFVIPWCMRKTYFVFPLPCTTLAVTDVKDILVSREYLPSTIAMMGIGIDHHSCPK